MRIVFTQFAPPFEHGLSEVDYLAYDDWYARLRRHFAARGDEVAFVSQTLRRERLHLSWQGYQAYFFPVVNPGERQHDGRLWYRSPEAESWLESFQPDILHVVGTGTEMAPRFLQRARQAVAFLWERTMPSPTTLAWPEIALCDYFLQPNTLALQSALAAGLPAERLFLLPLGADTDTFRPLELPRRYDLVSSGNLSSQKQYHHVQRLVQEHRLSWLHAGGYVKGRPYSRWQDLLYSHNMRRLGLLRGLKRSRDGLVASARFSHDRMPEVYNQGRLLVHPSVKEGTARAVQEALACATPVVGLRQTLPWVEPEFGLVVDTIEELGQAVLALLADPQRLAAMGRAGREWLLKNHSFAQLAAFVENLHRLPKKRSMPGCV
ncbi:MAG: glycosyltransferase family 4 protein [Magnetococcales bacterium]|nr:glycosyltransferase family 4 protein [Magnetococcales bacterium]